MHLLRTLRPVDMLHAAVKQSCIGCFRIILRLSDSRAGSNIINNLQEQRCALLTQSVMQLAHRRILFDRYNNLFQHCAGIHADIHLHNGYTGFLLALDDGILNRRCTTILRQQRCMNVDAAMRRQLQNLAAQKLAKGSNNNQLRLQLAQRLHELRSLHLLRLINRQALL